jgi:hypothetical protein
LPNVLVVARQSFVWQIAKGIANREEALERAEQLRRVFAELIGMSSRKMAADLNARKIPTPAGGQWHAVTVKRVLSRLA